MEYKNDGWSNLLQRFSSYNYPGVGTGLNRFNRTYAFRLLSQSFLDLIYRSSGIAKKIVDLIAEEMTREWIKIDGDPENLTLQRFEEIDIKKSLTDLIRWSRLYGGAIAVIGADDGRELDEPLNENQIRNVEFLHVFDRFQVTWTVENLVTDPRRPNLGFPEFYDITPVEGGPFFTVHESRVLRMDGETLPNRLKHNNDGWGDSVLEPIYRELQNFEHVTDSTSSIIKDFVQTILSIDNLQNLMASGRDDLVQKRINLIDQTRSVANSILLDSTEQYSKQSSSVSGLDALMDRFGQQLSAVSKIPYTFLFGVSPAGLQSTGQADIRMFYDTIKSEQEDKLKPILEKLTRLVMRASNGPFGGQEPEGWQIQFNPLWQLTEQEQADFRKTIAESDQIYIQQGVLDPSEVAVSRFGGEVFSYTTTIDLETRESPQMQENNETEENQETGPQNTLNSNQGDSNDIQFDAAQDLLDDYFVLDERTFDIPGEVANEAKRALKLRDQYKKGGTRVGIEVARTLANRGIISQTLIKKMKNFFDLHENDNLRQNDPPSAAFIAWKLFGGDPGRAFVNRAMARMREEDKMDAEVKKELENEN